MALRIGGVAVVNDNRDIVDIFNITASGIVRISSTVTSVSPTTGALSVTGGVGIAGTMWAGELRTNSLAIRLGSNAGATAQGYCAVAIGNQAGQNNQPANSIIINASGSALNGTNAGLYINPIRSDSITTSQAVITIPTLMKSLMPALLD